ncbi:baseplate J/gp47 family protein [Nitrosomonas sp.]|uniref:baseplate J/gp47 family protein n=1 Tax=Nitrosomonas sp. TaxID=42353 RepID=UPI00283E411C|nr:baseplate J/gp47 family protein [Nitrosomonas sp.]MDR4515332.1 baseplate J/gp47 family protein [Nitrosomonas sp.]
MRRSVTESGQSGQTTCTLSMDYCSDLITNRRLRIRDGTSQADRLLSALDQDYFQLVDLRFHALIAMAADYAGMMKFYHLNDKAEGNWKPYFTADETVIIAMILSIDTNKLAALYRSNQFSTKLKHNHTIDTLQKALPAEHGQQLTVAYYAACLLDHWLVSLKSAQSRIGQELHQLVESIIAGLKDDLQLLLQYFANFLPDKPFNHYFSSDLIRLLGISAVEQCIQPSDYTVRLTDRVLLRSGFFSIAKAIEMVQGRAADKLTASLHSQRHDPGTGLLIAFLQLFERLHKKINRFTSNYIDFYYEQVLGAQVHPFRPDHTYVVVRLNNPKHTALIPKDTVFLAGLDQDSREIQYVSNNDVRIHGARVSTIRTLFFDRDTLNSPENVLQETVTLPCINEQRTRQLATACWLNTISIRSEEHVETHKVEIAYPILGAPKITETETGTATHARIGCVLASKTLLLKEGKRTVYITIKFSEPDSGTDQNTLRYWVNNIAMTLKSSTVDSVKTDFSDEETQDIFFKVFGDLFVIDVSGEEGWIPIEEYIPVYSGVDSTLDENSLRIIFTLSADMPAVTPYSVTKHGENYGTELPVLRLLLNSRGYLYPYSILSKLTVESISIDVSVSGNRSLTLHNQLGQLSALASFSPFGPLPEVGSFWMVGCAEASVKQLTHFSIEIKWGGLPAGIGGFESYYQDYEGPDSHTDFKVGMTVLTDGQWLPGNNVPVIADTLFEVREVHQASNALDESRWITCDALMPYWSPVDYRQVLTQFSYTPSSKKGFFKFTLISPADAFGHKKYPQVLARVLTHNTRQRIPKMLKKEPNAPYTPVITSILANYRATAQLIIGKTDDGALPIHQDKLIHLHPIGWEEANAVPTQSVSLLPHYVYSGNLLIGLEGFDQGGTLTLYFHLRENSLPMENNSINQLQWYYLSSNQWTPLTVKEIVSDTTYGFMTSGIVTLNVPADINPDNTILPAGLYWLCVSADLEMEKFCSLYSIYAQAIQVNRQIDETISAKLTTFSSLPAGSINQTKQSIPGLDRIWQIQPSVNGRSAESKFDLRIRLSERLRHKNRALLPLDYEQLILAHFPQIFKVKCFANLMPEYDPLYQRFRPCLKAGHLTIVALPFPVKQAHYGKQLWLSGHRVNEVKQYIRQHIPSFVTVHCVNPVYESIQIRCTVKFKAGCVSGMYLAKLNEAISDYISPWHDTVGYTKHFGWRISKHDMQSYIQQLEYIDRVTNFSMLRITPDGEALFDLFDSAAVTELSEESGEITPKYPWSVAEPMRQHFIEVDDSFVTIEPEVTGIGELEIGSTFIVLSRDGEAKQKNT